MIIIRLKGGMGNQMFQYALGRNLAKKLNTELRFDLSSLLDRSRGKDFVYRDFDLDIFQLQAQFVTSPALLRNIYRFKSSGITKLVRGRINRGRRHVKEKNFHFQAAFLEQAVDESIYEGWFQSYRYFEGIEEEVRKAFSFRKLVLPESMALLEQIQSTNSICLNVRRTDFLKVDNLNTTNLAYFEKAAAYVTERVNQAHFFVFSDDIEWCRNNIRLDHPVHIVDHSHKGYKFGNYLQLMKACRHFIIPNSSFAWWASWLNQNPDKIVVAPKNWFKDPDIDTTNVTPPGWLRL